MYGISNRVQCLPKGYGTLKSTSRKKYLNSVVFFKFALDQRGVMLSTIMTSISFQYDVELYQRIEQLIGKQLPLYKTEESEVMVLQERVSEAQRLTKIVRINCNYMKLAQRK